MELCKKKEAKPKFTPLTTNWDQTDSGAYNKMFKLKVFTGDDWDYFTWDWSVLCLINLIKRLRCQSRRRVGVKAASSEKTANWAAGGGELLGGRCRRLKISDGKKNACNKKGRYRRFCSFELLFIYFNRELTGSSSNSVFFLSYNSWLMNLRP